MATYHPEKIVVEFMGRKKIVREEKSFCGYCGDFQPKVFLKPNFWPTELLLEHDELNQTVHLCLECRTAVYSSSHKASRLACYEQLRISVIETERLSVPAANSILAT